MHVTISLANQMERIPDADEAKETYHAYTYTLTPIKQRRTRNALISRKFMILVTIESKKGVYIATPVQSAQI